MRSNLFKHWYIANKVNASLVEEYANPITGEYMHGDAFLRSLARQAKKGQKYNIYSVNPITKEVTKHYEFFVPNP